MIASGTALTRSATLELPARSSFYGNVTFQYTINDGVSPDNATATVTLVIAPPPLAAADDYYEGPYNAALEVNATLGFLTNDGPARSATAIAGINVTAGVSPADGNLTAVDMATGSFTFMPARGFRGNTTFKYSAQRALGNGLLLAWLCACVLAACRLTWGTLAQAVLHALCCGHMVDGSYACEADAPGHTR